MADDSGGAPRNPCYACHVHSDPPNYADDGSLQLVWSLPSAARDNPWTNLFAPPVLRARHLTDSEILSYVRAGNYLDERGDIALAQTLRNVPADWDLNHDGHWGGYVPDVWFRFDEHGFDHRLDGSPSGWRAFAYYPFLGTFFPTNGSMDDVLIRLDPVLQQDGNGHLDMGVYALNLAIVESLIKRADVLIEETAEASVGVDLDLDGKLGGLRSASPTTAGTAGGARGCPTWAARATTGEIFRSPPGYFPLRTELFHSVRYLDVVEEKGRSPHVGMAARMKELRYAKKVRWLGFPALRGHAAAEAVEQRDARDGTPSDLLRIRTGRPERPGMDLPGIHRRQGWRATPADLRRERLLHRMPRWNRSDDGRRLFVRPKAGRLLWSAERRLVSLVAA